jgi:hypothetical protein
VRKVEKSLGSGYFKLNIGEAERRQAKHDIRSVEDAVVELVRNSRDAGAKAVFVATSKDSAGRRLMAVIDDGEGVPPNFHNMIFEPRVTSKVDKVIEDRFGVHGRGMALYSIRSNTDETRLAASAPGRGAAFVMDVSLKRLGERKDQSTLPKLKLTRNNGIKLISGPHNVWRHLIEMSLDDPHLDIFYGTHAEIIATLLSFRNVEVAGEPPIWSDLYDADGAEALHQASASLGLSVSLRTCQRLLSGSIERVQSIKSQLRQIEVTAPPPVKVMVRPSAGKISDEDLEAFTKAVTENFRNLGSSYFLRLNGPPKVICSKTKIYIELNVISDEGW